MTRSLKCALCAAAPFALLSATAAYATPTPDTPDATVATDDLTLPDAPVLASGPTDCGNGAPIRRPVLLRKTDLPDLDEFVETGFTQDPQQSTVAGSAFAALTHELRGHATAGLQLAAADEDSCENGIAQAALLKKVEPPKAPHRT